MAVVDEVAVEGRLLWDHVKTAREAKTLGRSRSGFWSCWWLQLVLVQGNASTRRVGGGIYASARCVSRPPFPSLPPKRPKVEDKSTCFHLTYMQPSRWLFFFADTHEAYLVAYDILFCGNVNFGAHGEPYTATDLMDKRGFFFRSPLGDSGNTSCCSHHRPFFPGQKTTVLAPGCVRCMFFRGVRSFFVIGKLVSGRTLCGPWVIGHRGFVQARVRKLRWAGQGRPSFRSLRLT